MSPEANPKAKYPRTRGFKPYRPQARAMLLIGNVEIILDEYEKHLPLTLRQLFYMMVVRNVLTKNERDYERLGEALNRARRAHMIPMNAIRDDGFTCHDAPGWETTGEFFSAFHEAAEEFRFDRQTGQDRRLLVWCEAGGMVPQLERVAFTYGVPVASSGGFDSTTVKHSIGLQLAEVPTTVLHIGDHDPSGVHMFGSLDEDVKAFAAFYDGDVEFVRLAVTPQQIREHNLPTAPPKSSDKRSFDGMTTQAEALDAKLLAEIVRDAITSRMDSQVYADVLRNEENTRPSVIDAVEHAWNQEGGGA